MATQPKKKKTKRNEETSKESSNEAADKKLKEEENDDLDAMFCDFAKAKKQKLKVPSFTTRQLSFLILSS